MASIANQPMRYPNSPPTTEAAVVKKARRQAAERSASTIGASMTSGGIGKNVASAKLRPARMRRA